jgi:hypothetical protein
MLNTKNATTEIKSKVKSTCSLALIIAASAILNTSTSLRAADTNRVTESSTTTTDSGSGNVTQDNGSQNEQPDLYRGNELSLDAFGTASLGQYTIEHPSNQNVRQDTKFGAGAGLNYFITRYIGIGAEAYSQNTTGTFIDSASANLMLRLPLGQSGFAPYILGGGGHQFDQTDFWFGQAGGGMEYRFCRNVGIFLDARAVWPNETKNYGVARLGLRFAF